MKIEKCKWKYGAQTPLMFMIDDYCNKYMIDKNDGNYLGSDWGGRCRAENSFLKFIEDELLVPYPFLKITMFLVVNDRAPITEHGLKSYAKGINSDEEFVKILNELEQNPRFELAYHGLTHGKVVGNDFMQEWALFHTLEDAKKSIEIGKETYREITGRSFTGGKYCGYAANDISDISIVNGGFKWWCRHWDMLLLKGVNDKGLNLDIDDFDGVVDIPSTVDGGLYSLRKYYGQSIRQVARSLYYLIKYRLTIEGIIDLLVENGFPVSIQEHTSPMREDNKRQTPNIIDDISNIKYILEYMKKYRIWYATGNEIADYYNIFKNTEINMRQSDLEVIISDKSIIGKSLWVQAETNEKIRLLNAVNNNECKKIVDDKGLGYFEINLYDEKSIYKIVTY